MAKYVFIYHGGEHPKTEEEGKKSMEKWHAWLASLGEAVIEPGIPMGMSKTVMSDGSVVNGGGSNPAGGFSIVSADDMDAALSMAQSSPTLQIGGTIEVAETFDMKH